MKREDHKLWKKVAATVKPLHTSSMRPLTDDELKQIRQATTKLDAKLDVLFAKRTPKSDFAARRAAAINAPIPLPALVAPTTLDLHGMTLQEAHRATLEFIASSGSHKKLTIITGKSGQIKAEFERWVEGIPKVHSVKAKCDGGAFTVRILKSCR